VSAPRPRVVVVGGGLSGLSCAVACGDAGAAVTLLEGRPRLGGATWSFERKGFSFDNGQHVHLRCCEQYRGFLERLGTAQLAPIRGSLAIPVMRPAPASTASDPEPSMAWIRRDDLPAPLHLARSLVAYGHLSLLDRLRLFPAALGLRRVPLDDPRLDTQTFGEWLRRHGQSSRAVSALWDLITLPTTNLPANEVSLALAAKVFQTGLLTDARAADIAWSKVPLAQLHVEPARRALEQLGAEVRCGAKVTELVMSGERAVRGVVAAGEVIEADAVVLAVPHGSAAALLPSAAFGDRPAPQLSLLGASPIVNVHFVFDRRVMDHELAAAVDSPVQFVFDRTAAAGVPPGSGLQVLAVSLSGADAEVGERPESLIAEQRRALAGLFPAVRQAEVVDAVVTREHEATFRGRPGTRPLRLATATAIPNLAVAGAWTDTGWPATMEGAVRSGMAAARHVMAAVGRGLPFSQRPKEVIA
jgi:squalene-associated FAD-dependent desaturase